MMKELEEWCLSRCNKHVYGRCTTVTCLKRGGWTGGPPRYEIATCEELEIAKKLTGTADGNQFQATLKDRKE